MNLMMNSTEDFPDVRYASEQGLLAIGGDLSVKRLLAAYRKGIFPWYNAGEPILWWSPDPRCVLLPDQYKAQRSLKKTIKKQHFVFSFDDAFAAVINHCAAPRTKNSDSDTWLSKDMRDAYIRLHQSGYAHSVETRISDELVGGLYGIALGGIFFGESMFSQVSDASKAALNFLISHLTLWNFQLIDCQITSPHLLRLGAVEMARTEFLERLEYALMQPGKPGNWKNMPLASCYRQSGEKQ